MVDIKIITFVMLLTHADIHPDAMHCVYINTKNGICIMRISGFFPTRRDAMHCVSTMRVSGFLHTQTPCMVHAICHTFFLVGIIRKNVFCLHVFLRDKFRFYFHLIILNNTKTPGKTPFYPSISMQLYSSSVNPNSGSTTFTSS